MQRERSGLGFEADAPRSYEGHILVGPACLQAFPALTASPPRRGLFRAERCVDPGDA